jgi:hypothetical protein
MACTRCGGAATPLDDEFRRWALDQRLPEYTVQAVLDALCSECQGTVAPPNRLIPTPYMPRGASA